MTINYKNVYVGDVYTIAGIYEASGPLYKYFDELYDKDFYYGEKSFEKAEIKMHTSCIEGILRKSNLSCTEIDLMLAGDLHNQLTSSNYMSKVFGIPFLGVYNACATSAEAMLIAANFIDSKKVSNCLISTSSHNLASEKQFRNPVEYGTPKPDYATFTSTGAAAMILSSKKSNIRLESATVGRVIDKGIKDVNNMGAVMMPAAADTIYNHLKDMKRDVNYYDLILTGDLGKYGKEMLKKYMKSVYNIDLSKNYNDCGTMLYDINNQPVFAGGSGPVCSALVMFSYILNEMKKKKIKRVLFVPTGALYSPVMFLQHQSLPAIAHAISLEVLE